MASSWHDPTSIRRNLATAFKSMERMIVELDKTNSGLKKQILVAIQSPSGKDAAYILGRQLFCNDCKIDALKLVLLHTRIVYNHNGQFREIDNSLEKALGTIKFASNWLKDEIPEIRAAKAQIQDIVGKDRMDKLLEVAADEKVKQKVMVRPTDGKIHDYVSLIAEVSKMPFDHPRPETPPQLEVPEEPADRRNTLTKRVSKMFDKLSVRKHKDKGDDAAAASPPRPHQEQLQPQDPQQPLPQAKRVSNSYIGVEDVDDSSSMRSGHSSGGGGSGVRSRPSSEYDHAASSSLYRSDSSLSQDADHIYEALPESPGNFVYESLEGVSLPPTQGFARSPSQDLLSPGMAGRARGGSTGSLRHSPQPASSLSPTLSSGSERPMLALPGQNVYDVPRTSPGPLPAAGRPKSQDQGQYVAFAPAAGAAGARAPSPRPRTSSTTAAAAAAAAAAAVAASAAAAAAAAAASATDTYINVDGGEYGDVASHYDTVPDSMASDRTDIYDDVPESMRGLAPPGQKPLSDADRANNYVDLANG
eukprot:m.85124 g.85124  ORF g.85124 m.85124 type:complete len:532 (+) comp15043_c0_seq3:128-1723(+)